MCFFNFGSECSQLVWVFFCCTPIHFNIIAFRMILKIKYNLIKIKYFNHIFLKTKINIIKIPYVTFIPITWLHGLLVVFKHLIVYCLRIQVWLIDYFPSSMSSTCTLTTCCFLFDGFVIKKFLQQGNFDNSFDNSVR